MAARFAWILSRRDAPCRGWSGASGAARWGCGIVAIVLGAFIPAAARGVEDGDGAVADGEDLDRGVDLPTDRVQERLLDRARRLVADGGWSDAATLLDEILGADRDFFVKPRDARVGGPWSSVKTEAARLIRSLPQAGRTAYELQFRARAERFLADAIAADDSAAVVAVARRWFATPAGQRAATLAALEALESGQPLAATAWLERLSAGDAAIEPTIALMRAWARDRAGDAAGAAAILERARAGGRGMARVAGREVAISFPPDRGLDWLRELGGSVGRPAGDAEWRQLRGDASRNAVTVASRPLLVPRYRVPLTRHPEESRRLDKLRREFADQGTVQWPAGSALAVGGTILAHAPLGLLAVDFATGKRIWLQTAPRAAAEVAEEGGRDALARTFDDFTSGGISSDGRLAFAVDTHPAALAGRPLAGDPFMAAPREPAWQGGNTLSAYEIAAGGKLAWRLPADAGDSVGRDAGPGAGAIESSSWFAGTPLVAGDRLYALVEQGGELRLDVLNAADGRVVWSQPLAELDEEHAITGRAAVARRLAGAAPALGDGVLVCPLGAGSVVAVDVANRTLLWAYDYARTPRDADEAALLNGRLRGLGGGLRGAALADVQPGRPRAGWCDDGPIIAASRVLLTPRDSDELHCLDLQDGGLIWKTPRASRLQVAGVVDGRVVVVARDAVEALALDTGRRAWRHAFEPGVAPSGRGILTADRLFLPLDAPEVVEIALDDGTIRGRSPARGGAVPGNLVAYRGEVISLGVDAIDVFHQAAAVEARIETAARESRMPSAQAMWEAQLMLERGSVRAGLERLRDVVRTGDLQPPPDTLATALAFALGRDFAAAVPVWRDCLPAEGLTPASRTAVRAVVDGSLKTGDLVAAWAAWRELFVRGRDVAAEPAADVGDPRCFVTEGRWLRGRLERLWKLGDAPLRAEIDAVLAAELAAASATTTVGRERALERLAEVAGAMPSGMAARERLAAAFAALLDAAVENDDALRTVAVRRDFLLIDLARSGDDRQRSAANEAIAAVRRGLEPDGVAESAAATAAWPLGRVEIRRSTAERTTADETRSRLVPLGLDEVAESFVPGLAAACDAQQGRLLFVDRFGRRLGEPVAVHDSGRFGAPIFDQAGLGAAALGRTVFVRSAGAIAAVDLSGRGNRRLWGTSDVGRPGLRFRMPGPAIPRNGVVPLGMRIVEPDAVPPPAAVWGRPVTAGLPVIAGRSLTVHDPATGGVLWERHGLPPAADLLNDDDVVCVGTADGRRSVVMSLVDGRLLHEIDLPDRRRRLLTCGRHVLAIGPLEGPAEGGIADTVRLEVLDVADRSTTSLGEFAGGARACPFAPGMVAVVEPAGGLTVIDVAGQRVACRARLPAMPRDIDFVEVRPWEDRLLVCTGRREEPEEDENDRHAIAPLQQMLIAGVANQPLDFCVWAVDRESGAVLWDVPATVARHCLLAGQPAGLPVLVFARQIQRNHDREHTYLSVLCLDKRTGHAVLEDDRIPAQPHLLFGCDVVGDPGRHRITVREHGGDPQRIALEFTGGPLPPRPPHQGVGRPVKARGFFEGWERWIQPWLPGGS
jgi:outer membrane protein assembly factor BamB